MLGRLARTSYRHRRRVVLLWLLLLAVAVVGGSRLGGRWATGGRLPGTDSQRAADILAKHVPQRWGREGAIVLSSVSRNRPGIDAYLAQVAALPGVSSVDRLQPAPAGDITLAPITLKAGPHSRTAATATAVENLARPLISSGVDVEFSGGSFTTGGLPNTEGVGLLAAALVLLLAFGSIVAMGLPITTALVSVGITLCAVSLVSRLASTPDFTPEVAAIIGIGVGIDYALFIVTRYRTALARLGSPEEAVVEAISTAGRAALFAGITVIVSLLGMFLIGIGYFDGLALGTSAAVAVGVAAALTLLPALLGFLGLGVNRLGVRRRARPESAGAWGRWAGFVQRHPWSVALSGLAVLSCAALPLLGMRLGSADAGNDPAGTTTRHAYELVARGFGPGANGPMLVVADTRKPGSAAALPALVAALRSTPGVAAVGTPLPDPSGQAALATLVPDSGPQAANTVALLRLLRDHVVPHAVAGTGLAVHVGGETASAIDFSTVVSRRLPIFIGAVLAVSFLLLLLMFRSFLVPLKAVLMNLLSIGAAYGVMVAIFQWGWGASLIGVSRAPIEPWVPIMLFAIVFGLSMDYEVFLLSAIKERYDATGDSGSAVTAGLTSTAQVITAAAAIMVVVFGTFVLSDLRGLKLIGLGLAVAVALDATVVRVVLVPATMELLGRANWWLPRWLDRLLPRWHVEAAPVAAIGPASTGPGGAPSRPGSPPPEWSSPLVDAGTYADHPA